MNKEKRLEKTYNRYLDVRDKKTVELIKENEKLNNIINELEKSLKEDRILANKTGKFVLENVYLYYLDKLQELKGSDKE